MKEQYYKEKCILTKHFHVSFRNVSLLCLRWDLTELKGKCLHVLFAFMGKAPLHPYKIIPEKLKLMNSINVKQQQQY